MVWWSDFMAFAVNKPPNGENLRSVFIRVDVLVSRLLAIPAGCTTCFYRLGIGALNKGRSHHLLKAAHDFIVARGYSAWMLGLQKLLLKRVRRATLCLARETVKVALGQIHP
jgi:hypothetical protein